MATDTADALLAAIRAQPDDDAPRLAYSDWLEQQGDADRAEFLRIQITRAHLPPFALAADLERRQQHLFNRHPEWLTEADPLWERAYPIFRRGFLEDVHCEAGDWVAQVEPLSQRAPLTGVRVSLLPDNPLPAPEHLTALPNLKHLSLIGAGTLPPGFWDACATLTSLHLDAESLSVADADAILSSGLPGRLRSLTFTGQFNPEAFVRLLCGRTLFGNLQELSFSFCFLSPDLLDALVHLDMPELRSFGMTMATDRPPDFLSRLLDVGLRPRLDGVGLGSCRLAPNDYQALAACPGLAKLTSLGLAHNRLARADLDHLLAGPHAPRLHSLYLLGCHLGAAGLDALAEYPVLDDLRSLSLGFASPTPTALTALATSAYLSGLHDLDLSHCGVTADGVWSLVEHAPWRLADLNLSRNDLGDEGVRVLVEEGDFCLPVRLHLGWNGIGERGVAALAGAARSQRLGDLSLLHNPLGDAGLLALAASPHLGGLWRIGLIDTEGSAVGDAAIAQRFGPAACRNFGAPC